VATVEVIQIRLLGREGIILWPASRDNPPTSIYDERILQENPRVFPSPNKLGPVFEYKLDKPIMTWILVNTIKPEE
jgi:hypothetical protein